MPLISVVIPAFNARGTVEGAIQSALAQSEKDLEVIVVDDASSDSTSEIAKSFPDPRLRLIRNHENLGAGATRDRAIAAAKGKWLAVLDADDYWHPRRLEVLLAAAGEDTDVMVFDDILNCHSTKRGLEPWQRMHGAFAFGAKNAGCIDVPPARWANARQFLIKPLIPSAMLRSSGVRHSTLSFGEDTEFFLRLLAAGMKMRYVPEAYYYYRITPGSLSANPARSRLMRDMLVQALPLFANDLDMVIALKRKISYRDFTMSIKAGNASTAIQQALKSPWLVGEFMARCFGELIYHSHRISHHGSRRGNGRPIEND